MEIPVDDINNDAGMNTLHAKPDLFFEEEKDRTFETHSSGHE